MSYFPFFVDLEGRCGLIVGGGSVAARKVEKLMPYGPKLTVVAPQVTAQIFPEDVTILQRPFEERDLDGMFFVIAAAVPEVNRRVAALCRKRDIPVNVVDEREECSFFFPALVKQGSLSVGISTGGASPTAAVYLKEQIKESLPPYFDALLTLLQSLRPLLKQRIRHEQLRAKAHSALFYTAINQGRLPDAAQIASIIDAFSEQEDAL